VPHPRSHPLGWLAVAFGALLAAAGGVGYVVVAGLGSLDSGGSSARAGGTALLVAGLGAGALLAWWGLGRAEAFRRWARPLAAGAVALAGLVAPWVVAVAAR